MRKLSADCSLCVNLRRARKKCRLTQKNVALKAGIATRTVWGLEKGQGTVSSFYAVLDAIGHSLFARNVSGDKRLDLRTLRRRRGMSQLELAQIVGVSHPTIRAIEKNGLGRLSTFERVLAVLGVSVAKIIDVKSAVFEQGR